MSAWTDLERVTRTNEDPATAEAWDRAQAVPNEPDLDPADAGRTWRSQPLADVDGEPGELTLLREQLIVGAGITSIPPPEPLIAGLLDLDSVAVFYGRPGCGKSFAAIDVAASVASRISWQHLPTTHGGVLYIAAEGVGGLGVRVRAWQEYHALAERTNGGHSTDANIDRLTWLPRPVNLLEPRWLEGLIALVAEIRPVLVVIDTVARSMIGGDENTSKDMGKVVEAGDRIRRAAGSCVLFVHHSGKDEGRGMRGSNSLEGGCDTAWEITREVQWVTLNCQRQKNHATDEKPITLGMGNIAGSVVLVPDTRRAIDTMHDNLKTTLVALDQVETGTGTSTSVWLKSSELAEKTFYNHRKKLLELALVANVGTDKQPKYILTEEGRSCITTAITAK